MATSIFFEKILFSSCFIFIILTGQYNKTKTPFCQSNIVILSMIKNIVFSLIIGFIGFASGRIGHILGGTSVSPHHWIYALLIIILGLLLHSKYPKLHLFIIVFGIGLFISDLRDFLNLQFYGADTVTKFVFWSID